MLRERCKLFSCVVVSITNSDLFQRRIAVLANGATLPLSEAIGLFGRLTATQGADDLEWDPLYHLRALALGQPLGPEPTQVFIRAGLLDHDGGLEPGFRDVILSAVRGEDRALHIESPFTDPLDRALAEFACARDIIIAAADLGQLDRDETRAFLAPSRFDKALDEIRDTTEAARHAGEDSSSGGNVPPRPDPRSFAQRVLERAAETDSSDRTPPTQ